MALTHKTTHVEEAKEQLAQQFHGKAKLEALLSALIQQVQEAEDAAFTIINGFNLDTAVGDQLDCLGAIVGEPRNARTDTTYRLWIRARILLNRSSGKTEEIYAIFNLLIPAGTEPELTDYYPAEFVLSITGVLDDEDLVDQLALILHEAKAAGVGASLMWQEAEDADMFTFASILPGTATVDGDYFAPQVNISVRDVVGTFPGSNFIDVGGTESLEYDELAGTEFNLADPTSIDHFDGETVTSLASETSTTQGFADASTGGGGKLAGVTRSGEFPERYESPDAMPWLSLVANSPRPPPEEEGGGGGDGYSGPPL